LLVVGNSVFAQEADMKPRKPQNARSKAAKTVKVKRQTPLQPGPPQAQSASKRTRTAAKRRLREEVIFPKDDPRKIKAEAEGRTQAYSQLVKAKLAASKGSQRLIMGSYLEWLRKRVQQANPGKRVPKRSARGLAPLVRFDWRESGIVSSVRNQNKTDCSACWAFAATAAYETSLRRNQNRFQSVAIQQDRGALVQFADFHIAVQDVLKAVSKGRCEAGWPGDAFDHFVKKGIQVYQNSSFEKLPDSEFLRSDTGHRLRDRDFIGKKHHLKKEEKNTVKAIAWDYVQADPGKIPSTKQMKEALLEHGPLVVLVNLDDAFKDYPKNGELFTATNSHSVNHVVLLTGWDDDKDAWIIQNSFGTAWGISCLEPGAGSDLDNTWMPGAILNMKRQRGCMYITRRANHIGQFAMWIEAPFNLDE
jgi:C1A family cysteine protease